MLHPENDEVWKEAIRNYETGNKIIALGAFSLERASEISNILQAGFGAKDLAKALLNVPRLTVTAVEVTRIYRFESLAIHIETQGFSLFARVSRSSSITLVRTLAKEFRDWSEVIEEGVHLLRDLQEVFQGD